MTLEQFLLPRMPNSKRHQNSTVEPQLTGVERNARQETKHERTDIPILAEPEVVPLPNRDLGRLSRDRSGFRTAACQTGASIRRFERRDHCGRSDRAFRVCW